MPVWLVRAGSHGEFEQKFVSESRIYVTWDGLAHDISKLPDKEAFYAVVAQIYPDAGPKRLANWVGQLWPFAHGMNHGDLVMVPLKTQGGIQVGQIVGDYEFHPGGPDPFFHSRAVKWIGDAIPRTQFGQDILYTLGAFLTICRVQRNNAEQRIRKMAASGWSKDPNLTTVPASAMVEGEADAVPDVADVAQDQIAEAIMARFKGHSLTRLVEAILQAEGYTTYRSPEGADGGADILAGAGPLGFGAPRLCVEVKSGDAQIERPAVDKLLGAVAKFQAQEGLFVSWGGFKSNVPREMASSFFKVRLWSRVDLLDALFATYERLDPEIRAELPLKRIWALAAQD